MKALASLGDAGWSSLVAEKQHGSLAVLRLWHPEYSSATLLGRALLLQVRRLLPSVSSDERQLARLQSRLQSVLSQMRSRNWEHSTREVPKDVRIHIFKGPAKLWAERSLEEQRMFEQMARVRASTEMQDEAERLRAERQLLLDRVEAYAEEIKPIIMPE